ncbi:MAG: hypothetical protein ABWZ25_18120 [Chitinophagaceae bacterium]
MNFEISRIVGMNDLLRRPRVSYKVSEDIFSYVNNNLLETKNILQGSKFSYKFTLSFSFGIPRPNRILYTSPFATHDTLFVAQKGIRVVDKTVKWAFLSVISDSLNEAISPSEYASLVFKMFADFLVCNFKRVKKAELDELYRLMDIDTINSYAFPAPFDDQRYVLDDGKFGDPYTTPMDWETIEWKSAKDEYLKHYSF